MSYGNMRGFWRWAGVALALVTNVADAGGAARASSAVWAIGLPDGYIMMEYEAAVIHVTADSVARGVVEVRGGSRFVITSNSPTRYTVSFFNRGALFRAVRVDGMGRAVEFGPAGGTVAQQEAAAGRRVISLDYRFTLAPDATPGTYAWPLELVARGEPAIRKTHE